MSAVHGKREGVVKQEYKLGSRRGRRNLEVSGRSEGSQKQKCLCKGSALLPISQNMAACSI